MFSVKLYGMDSPLSLDSDGLAEKSDAVSNKDKEIEISLIEIGYRKELESEVIDVTGGSYKNDNLFIDNMTLTSYPLEIAAFITWQNDLLEVIAYEYLYLEIKKYVANPIANNKVMPIVITSATADYVSGMKYRQQKLEIKHNAY